MAHSAPHSRPPPRNTPWYDPWRVVTGRAPSAPRAGRVRVRHSLLHPTTTLHHPPWRPTKRRARVSHARNASVKNTQSYLCMKRCRTRYRTALGASKQIVSDFWVIFWEGPKRQPTQRALDHSVWSRSRRMAPLWTRHIRSISLRRPWCRWAQYGTYSIPLHHHHRFRIYKALHDPQGRWPRCSNKLRNSIRPQ